jgi:acyl-[acyl-carrier-protein] desaturase
LNTGLIAQGKSEHPEFAQDTDPILARVAQAIAVDEAAHYNFFLEGARLFLYYYPAQAIEALHDVIKFFAMPAGNLIPNYDRFAEIVAAANIYGPREHIRDVLDVSLKHLGTKGRAALRKGINMIRQVPTMEGALRETAIFDVLDYEGVKAKVQNVFDRINEYEAQVGFNLISPLQFSLNNPAEA